METITNSGAGEQSSATQLQKKLNAQMLEVFDSLKDFDGKVNVEFLDRNAEFCRLLMSKFYGIEYAFDHVGVSALSDYIDHLGKDSDKPVEYEMKFVLGTFLGKSVIAQYFGVWVSHTPKTFGVQIQDFVGVDPMLIVDAQLAKEPDASVVKFFEGVKINLDALHLSGEQSVQRQLKVSVDLQAQINKVIDQIQARLDEKLSDEFIELNADLGRLLVSRYCRTELDYDLKGVTILSDFIESHRISKPQVLDDTLKFNLAAYFGKCVISEYHGAWTGHPTLPFCVRLKDTLGINPIAAIIKQIDQGLSASIVDHFVEIKAKLDSLNQAQNVSEATDNKQKTVKQLKPKKK